MFVAEAHQRLRPSGDFGDGQSAVIQRFAHVQEDDGVHDVAEYLSADGVDGPFGERKQAEVLLAGLDDAFDVRAPEVVREQFRRGELLVGKQHEVAEPHGQPVLLLVLHGRVLVGVVEDEVALPLEGVVLVHVNIGIDLFVKQHNFLTLAEVHVPAAHEAVLSLVQAGSELMVERLEGEALPGRHPADEGLLRPVVERMDDLLGDVTGIQDKGVDGDVKTDGHVIHHGHDGAYVQHVAGNDVVPYRKAGLLVQHQHEAGLDGRTLHAVAAQGVERVVVNVVGQRRGVHVAAPAEAGVRFPHPLHEGLEEGHPCIVPAHHREVGRVAAKRCERDVAQDVRRERLLHEAVTPDPASIPENAVQNVTQDPLAVGLLRKGSLQDIRHARLHEEVHQQVGVSEHGVDLRLRKDFHVAGKPLVIPADLVEAVGNGIVGHETALRGEEDAALAVAAKPHDLPQALPHDLPGVELPSVLDVPGLLDGGAAAGDVAVCVPDQLLNPYECHAAMPDLISVM